MSTEPRVENPNKDVSSYLLLNSAEQRFFTAMEQHPHLGTKAVAMVTSFLAGQIPELIDKELIPGQKQILQDLAEEYGIEKLRDQ